MRDEREGAFAERPLIRWLRAQFGNDWSASGDPSLLFEVERRLREQTLRLIEGNPETKRVARLGVVRRGPVLRPSGRGTR